MQNKTKIEKKCYVCGLELYDYPYYLNSHPKTNENVICSCFGIHYGYDDEGAGDIIPDELTYRDWKFGDENHIKIIKFWRKYWIDGGMKWWSLNPKPENWDPKKQLKNITEGFK